MVALVAGAILYIAVFGFPKVPHAIPLTPPIPPKLYVRPTPPMHDLRKTALVVTVVFGATLLNYLHPLAPVVKMLGSRSRSWLQHFSQHQYVYA